MRLFISNQNCIRPGRVAGSIPDEEAVKLDAMDGDPVEQMIYMELLGIEHDLSNHISDCTGWDGSREELIEEFENEIHFLEVKGVHDSNALFRLNRAKAALDWLK